MQFSNTYSNTAIKENFLFSQKSTIGKFQISRFNYVKKDHLQNVRVTISDMKLWNDLDSDNVPDGGEFTSSVASYNNYYAFGSQQPSRSYSPTDYRYGAANGNEKDPEIAGVDGAHYTTQNRELDTRLGRWWSIDNKWSKYPQFSPYIVCADNPIYYKDDDGNDIIPYQAKTRDEAGKLVWTYGNVSKTTEAVLKDMLKTKEGFEFLSQFAKKGQTIGGYTFTENGKNSMHDLYIADISLEDDDGNIPSNVAGEFGATYNKDKNNLTFTLALISKDENKYSLGETYTHESQLHGGIIETFTKAFKLGGEAGFLKAKADEDKNNKGGIKDHLALKNTDYMNPAFKRYNTQKWSLIKNDPKYLPAFDQAKKDAQEHY